MVTSTSIQLNQTNNMGLNSLSFIMTVILISVTNTIGDNNFMLLIWTNYVIDKMLSFLLQNPNKFYDSILSTIIVWILTMHFIIVILRCWYFHWSPCSTTVTKIEGGCDLQWYWYIQSYNTRGCAMLGNLRLIYAFSQVVQLKVLCTKMTLMPSTLQLLMCVR